MNLDEICKSIYSNGFQCYLVGGAVRDEIMAIPCHDHDIATNARPEQLMEIFKDGKINEIGKAFKVIVVDGFEIATFRKDVYINDYQELVIEYADTIEEDLARRDLTINALAKDYKTGKIIDEWNGISDIKNSIIKFVGDPECRLKEDYARAIRACRFYCHLSQLNNTQFNEESFEAIKRNSHTIRTLPGERVYLEILKAMKIKNSSEFFYTLQWTGLLKFIIPEMASLYCVDGGHHHNETVFEHCMICGDIMSDFTDNPLLKLAAYLHDIGKIAYEFLYNGDLVFYDHEDTSKMILGSRNSFGRLYNLKFSNEEIDYISNIAGDHMLQYDTTSKKVIRRILKRLNDHSLDYKDMITLFACDRASNLKREAFSVPQLRESLISNFEEVINEKENAAFSTTQININGFDIMSLLKLQPGKMIGQILNHILELIMDEKLINTKEVIEEYLLSESFDLAQLN